MEGYCIDCDNLLDDGFCFYCYIKDCPHWKFENYDESVNKMFDFDIEEDLDDDLFV